MSARREKRLRKLEAHVEYLDGRVRSVERRQLDQDEMYFGVVTAPKDGPVPVPQRRILLRRLMDSFRGRAKPNE